jgi:hypothetical protein
MDHTLAALDFMPDTTIRAMLRGATRAKVLFGWCPYEWGGETYWVVTPPGARTSTYTTAEAVDYCRMLSASGVEPLYRAA